MAAAAVDWASWSTASAHGPDFRWASRRSSCSSTRRRSGPRTSPATSSTARSAVRRDHERPLRSAHRVLDPGRVQRRRGLRHARGAAPAHPRHRRRVHRRRPAPARRVRRPRPRGGRPLPGDPRRDARARLPHADGRACTSTSGCPTPRRRSTCATGCARICRCFRRSPPSRRSGSATTPAWPARARRSSAASRAPPSRPRSRAGSTTRTSSAGASETAEVAGLHVPVVGHPAEPEAGHGRGPRDGRAEPAGVRGRARGARARARRRLRGRSGRGGAAHRRAHGVLIPCRARRGGRDDLVARRDPADPRGGRRRARARPALRPRARRRGRARGGRAHPARGRWREPHARGPCHRRDGRDARAASPGSPATPRPRRRRRSAASRRSHARSRPARAGSRGWRCTAGRTRSRGWRSRG